jgi:hypothetical protein
LGCVCERLTPHYNQSNIYEILRQVDGLQRNIYFCPYLSHDWTDLATTLHLTQPHMHYLMCQLCGEVSLMKFTWLVQCTGYWRVFVLPTCTVYWLLACICASILVLFLKIGLMVQTDVSLLIAAASKRIVVF